MIKIIFDNENLRNKNTKFFETMNFNACKILSDWSNLIIILLNSIIHFLIFDYIFLDNLWEEHAFEKNEH